MLDHNKACTILALLCAAAQGSSDMRYHRTIPNLVSIFVNDNGSLTFMTCEWSHIKDLLRCRFGHTLVDDSKFLLVNVHRDKYLSELDSRPVQHKIMLTDDVAVHDWGFVQFGQRRWVSLIDTTNHRHFGIFFDLDDLGRKRNPNFHVVVYHDGFHVLLDSKLECGERNSPCILRYNRRGDQVGKPVRVPSKFYENAMVADRHDSSAGVFFTTSVNTSHGVLMNASHLRCNGTETPLFENHFTRRFSVPNAVWSSEHGYLALCSKIDSYGYNVRCVQSNTDGRKKMNTSLYMEGGSDVIGVFNRPAGGIAVAYFDSFVYPYSVPSALRMQIQVVESNGSVAAHADVVVQGLSPSMLDSREVVITYAEARPRHCFHFAYPRLNGQSIDTEYAYKCIIATSG